MAKKNNNILLISVFAVLIIIYFITLPSSSSSSLDKSFIAYDSSSINEIKIEKMGQIVTLTKSADHWTVENHKVDANAIENILNTLKDVEISRLVTENENKYDQYEVNAEKGIKLTINNSDIYYLGKQGASYKSIMIRKEGESSVFATKNNFKSNFDKTALDFKDKTVIDISKENIASMIIENLGTKLYVMNMDSLSMINGDDATNEPQVKGSWMVNSMYTKLNTLKATDFSDASVISNIPKTLSIMISKRDGNSITLDIYPKDDTIYYVKNSDSDLIYLTNKSDFSQFEKSYEELKEK